MCTLAITIRLRIFLLDTTSVHFNARLMHASYMYTHARFIHVHTCTRWQDVITHCSAVLQVQPANVKALLRRAEARSRLQQYGGASSDCQAVLRIEPQNVVRMKKKTHLLFRCSLLSLFIYIHIMIILKTHDLCFFFIQIFHLLTLSLSLFLVMLGCH